MQRESAKWLLLEGTAIVASILLAFAIDAWWENFRETTQENRLLRSLSADLKENVDLIDQAVAFNKGVIASARRLFELSASPGVSREDVDALIGDLTWYWEVAFYVGTIQSIASAGSLEVIDDSALRARIAAMPSIVQWVERTEQVQQDILFKQFWPYIAQEGYLPQIHSASISHGMPGGVHYQGQSSYTLIEPASDHTALLDDKQFLGLLLIKSATHEDALNAYESVW